MDRMQFAVEPRTEIGTWAAKRLRKRGLVPGVIYGKGIDAQPVQVEARSLAEFLRGGHGGVLVDLRIEGGDGEQTETVMVREVQRNPITGQLLNIDFHRISLEEEVTTVVPITLVGEPEALKHGGILEQVLREVQVSCLPTVIPDHLEVDISGLDIGGTLHADALPAPEGVALQVDPGEAIAVMAAPRIEEEVAPPAEAAEEAAIEPELVGKPGKEEEAGEEAEAEQTGKG